MTMKSETTGRSLPVRARRTLGRDDEIETHRTVACARRGAVPIAECLRCADCHGLRVDADGRVSVMCCGEESEYRPLQVGRRAADRIQLSSIMTGDVFCVRADLRIAELHQLLANESFSGVPVVNDDGIPIGVVSRTDLITAEPCASGTTVNDIMMPMAFVLRETATVAQAAALMAYEGVHRLPVVDDRGAVVGIVSTMDVVRWVAMNEGYVMDRRSETAR